MYNDTFAYGDTVLDKGRYNVHPYHHDFNCDTNSTPNDARMELYKQIGSNKKLNNYKDPYHLCYLIIRPVKTSSILMARAKDDIFCIEEFLHGSCWFQLEHINVILLVHTRSRLANYVCVKDYFYTVIFVF